MNQNLIESVKYIETAIFRCFGPAWEDDLPQVENEDDVITDLLQERTCHARSEAKAEMLEPQGSS